VIGELRHPAGLSLLQRDELPAKGFALDKSE
jgi:hypothetical protein